VFSLNRFLFWCDRASLCKFVSFHATLTRVMYLLQWNSMNTFNLIVIGRSLRIGCAVKHTINYGSYEAE